MKKKKQFDYILSEEDFYPPSDNRCLKTNIYDVQDGENFLDYCEYFFSLLDTEDYWEN